MTGGWQWLAFYIPLLPCSLPVSTFYDHAKDFQKNWATAANLEHSADHRAVAVLHVTVALVWLACL